MTTRPRDWVILAVVLTAVFGVSLRAPQPKAGDEPASVRGRSYSPAAAPSDYRPRPRVPRTAPPFPSVDPRPMLLYVR